MKKNEIIEWISWFAAFAVWVNSLVAALLDLAKSFPETPKSNTKPKQHDSSTEQSIEATIKK